MLRLLVDPRVSLDPTRVEGLPATFVLALNDALDLQSEADRRAADGDD